MSFFQSNTPVIMNNIYRKGLPDVLKHNLLGWQTDRANTQFPVNAQGKQTPNWTSLILLSKPKTTKSKKNKIAEIKKNPVVPNI